MKNDHTKTIFYLDLKHVHKYGCAKFQPNPLFSSQQMGTEHAGGKKKKKKVGKPIGLGEPVGTGCPNNTLGLNLGGLIVEVPLYWQLI